MDQREPRGPREQLDQRERARQVLQAQLGLLEEEAPQDLLEQELPVLLGLADQQDLREVLVRRGLLARVGIEELLVQLGPQAALDQLDRLDLQDLWDQLVRLGQQVLEDPLDPLVERDRRVWLVLRDLLESQDPPDIRELLDLLVQQAQE
jgi:hypothetical protein